MIGLLRAGAVSARRFDDGGSLLRGSTAESPVRFDAANRLAVGRW
jgi:hypothetical protein